MAKEGSTSLPALPEATKKASQLITEPFKKTGQIEKSVQILIVKHN